MRHRILIATRSEGKLRELKPLFADAGLDVIDLTQAGIPESPAEESIEQFDTFEENALAKAHYFYRLSHLPTIAEDSGLVVDALGGKPGVHSKRWSGGDDDANNRKLVEELTRPPSSGVSQPPQRPYTARYVCVAAYVNGSEEHVRRGEAQGEIVLEPAGAGGFGYDPHFFSRDLGRTFAELPREEKERVSHRGRAFKGLLAAIRGL